MPDPTPHPHPPPSPAGSQPPDPAAPGPAASSAAHETETRQGAPHRDESSHEVEISPGVRAGDADREEAADRLRAAVGEGRISVDELVARVDRVYTARTIAELSDLLADLPTGEPPSTTPQRDSVLELTRGKLVRDGRWTVPPLIKVRIGGTGKVRLDFTAADCRHREIVVDLEVRSWFNDVTILVPRGWQVRAEEVRRQALGAVFNRPPIPLAPDGVVVHLTGYVRAGDIWIKYRRPRP
ncbi:DUF1707 domain-containing protein [Nonomuraea sp. NPDC050328]|uniref:DUF1707 SHOCT-like domain-containing protein n=1 Tax=Nonomuraea sp. NPDC050328 TaxID=3364361 RepID=UPI00379D5D63